MNESQLPPLRDLPPGRLAQRADHLGVEIELARPAVSRAKVFALVAACALIAAGLSVAFLGFGGNASHTGGADGPGMVWIPNFPASRVLGTVIPVRAYNLVWANGSATVTVLRCCGRHGLKPWTVTSDVAYRLSQPVFREHVAMTEEPGQANGSTPVAWQWEGSLSTSDWAGGCADDHYYSVEVLLGDPTGYSMGGWTQWFTCRPGALGATGDVGPTGDLGPTGAP